MKCKWVILIWPAILICSFSIAQQLSFKTYTSAEGLSQHSGYCIAQDQLGYIWMGTQDGLNRFNGKKIITYYKETISRGELSNNFIKCLSYDSARNWLWIGTARGLTIYNISSDSFYKASAFFPSADTLDGLMIRSVSRISPEETVVVTNSEGLFVCNAVTKNTRQFFQQPETKNRTMAAIEWEGKLLAVVNGKLFLVNNKPELLTPGIDMGDVRKLIRWQNDLWIASSDRGLFQVQHPLQPLISPVDCRSNKIGALAIDINDQLWIGTRDKGIVILQAGNPDPVLSFEKAINKSEWPKQFTLSLMKDAQGNMWVGSSGCGFSMTSMSVNPFKLIRKESSANGIPGHNMILSMFCTNDKLLLLGTQLEGLQIYRKQPAGTFTLDVSSGQLLNNAVYGIVAETPGSYWLATDAGLYNFNLISNKISHYVDPLILPSLGGQSLLRLANTDSLIYSSNRGTAYFDLKNKKFRLFNFKTAGKPGGFMANKMLQDESGIVWIAGMAGLIRFDPHTDSLAYIDPVSRYADVIQGICKSGNDIWMGTTKGILVYDILHNNIKKSITILDGLPDNVVYSIEKDAEGFFWGSTNRGFVRVDPQNYSFTHIPGTAGLQAGEFNGGCSVKDNSGNLFFGGINGVTYFNPEDFSLSGYSPSPLIESVKIYNKELRLDKNIAYTDNINLKNDQNFISFEFGVNNFTNNDECTYRYRLTGADGDWVLAGNRNYVSYANLKPGNYEFRLQSANSSGVWSSKITRMQITISPAWWQTWWLKLIAGSLLMLLLVLLLRKRISTIRHKAAIKQQITETEMAALKAQMNPHFMFNCINSIDSFIHNNDKYNATLYLNKFAKLLRNILDSSRQNVVLFTKDMETLKLYLELEELRHDSKFKTSIQIDEELADANYKVPPLIIQPFVENAILHGLKNKPGNTGVLLIDIKKTGEFIQYTITDNGIGRTAAGKINQNKESSYGMQMSFDRVKLFNQEKSASIEVVDLLNEGVAAGTTIIVKLKIS